MMNHNPWILLLHITFRFLEYHYSFLNSENAHPCDSLYANCCYSHIAKGISCIKNVHPKLNKYMHATLTTFHGWCLTNSSGKYVLCWGLASDSLTSNDGPMRCQTASWLCFKREKNYRRCGDIRQASLLAIGNMFQAKPQELNINISVYC